MWLAHFGGNDERIYFTLFDSSACLGETQQKKSIRFCNQNDFFGMFFITGEDKNRNRKKHQHFVYRVIDTAASQLTKTAITVTAIFIVALGYDLWHYLLGHSRGHMSTSLTHRDRNMVSNVVMGIQEMAVVHCGQLLELSRKQRIFLDMNLKSQILSV